MADTQPMTVAQLVLLAAGRLGETFTFAELTVATWKAYPESFRLGPDLDYPDALKVSYTIMGRKGLIGNGWITKVGKKLYAVSDQGRAEVAKMINSPRRAKLKTGRRTAVLRRLPLEDDKAIATALASRAFRMYQMGLAADVSWMEAIKFWGNTVRAGVFAQALDDTIAKGEKEFQLRDRQVVSLEDLQALRGAHDRLAEKFCRQLERR